jgi:hypothetical protein
MTIHWGNCLAVMASLPESSVDAIVTDPPYGLGFMGKAWDDLPPGIDFAREALRVLKPGGFMLAFGGTRTWHRLAVAIEDGGFELRDSIAWLYGSGFPKSLDVGKAIDKAAGVERTTVTGVKAGHESFIDRTDAHSAGGRSDGWERDWRSDPAAVLRSHQTFAPATPEAAQWQGWGTALKPAFEPIIVARKPFPGTVAANVLEYGTGAINVDGCRIGDQQRPVMIRTPTIVAANSMSGQSTGATSNGDMTTVGRWPANVVLDEDAAAELGESARFFYCPKASKRERPVINGISHPTVKPLALTRWLVRLITPPGGIVLDPFAGSGTTAEA